MKELDQERKKEKRAISKIENKEEKEKKREAKKIVNIYC